MVNSFFPSLAVLLPITAFIHHITVDNITIQIPILWPPDVRSLLIGKDPEVGKY